MSGKGLKHNTHQINYKNLHCTVLQHSVSYNEVLNHIRYYKNTKMKNTQQNSDEHFSLNNVLYCYEIKISVNQHLNSSLSEAEEQPSVHIGIVKTATIMTAHTRAHIHTHRYLFTGIMS